ncbi:hypothetical protein F2P79_026026, partial [Pimephales promelas]
SQLKKECVDTSPENHVPGSGVGHDAGTAVSCSDGVYPDHSVQDEARPGHHCQTLSESVGSHGSSVQHDTFWPATYESLAVVVESQGVFPKDKTILLDKGYAQMPSFPFNLEEALVPVPGSQTGSIISQSFCFDRCLPHGLGRGHGRPLFERYLAGPSFLLAHKLPRNVGGVLSSEEFSARPPRSPRSSENRQYVSGVLFKPPGGSEVAPSVQTGTSDPPVVPAETVVSQGDVCPGEPEPGSRHAVKAGAEARRMETPPRGGGVNGREVRPSGGGLICVSRDDTLSTVVLPHTSSPAGVGCPRADVAEAGSVRFSPNRSAPSCSGESPSRRDQPSFSSPVLAGPSMVLGHHPTSSRPAMVDPFEEGPVVSGGGLSSPPTARAVETLGLAPEGARYLEAGLSAERA